MQDESILINLKLAFSGVYFVFQSTLQSSVMTIKTIHLWVNTSLPTKITFQNDA